MWHLYETTRMDVWRASQKPASHLVLPPGSFPLFVWSYELVNWWLLIVELISEISMKNGISEVCFPVYVCQHQPQDSIYPAIYNLKRSE